MPSREEMLTGAAQIDFVPWWRRALILSAVLVVISIGALAVNGLNFGIDFEGGIAWEVKAVGVSTADARAAVADLGLEDAKIQQVGEDVIRVQAGEQLRDREREVATALAELAEVDVSEVSINTVGPSWGEEITRAALRALLFFFAAILVYLSWRLEWRMAVTALIAVAHDILVSAGIYAVFGFEVAPATVIAFLTILGYSIYDTIVVFDKVQENQAKLSLSSRMTYTQLMNRSMNQVLWRSINTTVSSMIPVLCLLIIGSFVLGVTTLRDFAVALAVGLAAGAYSSVFVAAPVLTFFKEREPRNRAIRERLESGRATPLERVATPDAVGADRPVTSATAGHSSATAARLSSNHPPRPRKKKKR